MNYSLIESNYSENNIIEKILSNRGININNIFHYLNTTEEDILDPLTLSNMKEGAEMLISHIKQGNNIFIQVDSDCDGFASAALLINYLNYLFPSFAQNHIYYRLHTGKQHGLIPETIPENISLIILPDSSSNNYLEHQEMKEKGVDILVLDHHHAEKVSPYACVINNQLCDYANKTLAGAGIVYKFCSYIDSLINKNYVDNLLDLVALSLIGDMMDLKNFETRYLVDIGLKQIKNPYFVSMVEKQEYSLSKEGKDLTPHGIAFYIVPYINATIRVGTQEEKMTLFESLIDFLAYDKVPSTKRGCKGQLETRVEQACRNCINIKKRQTTAVEESLSKIEQKIEDEQLLSNQILIITLPQEQANRNLTGLIANQLMSKYQRPVLLLTDTGEKYEGSGRNVGMSNFVDFRQFCADSKLVEYAEGHASAFGFGIQKSLLNNFISYSNDALKEFDFSPSYKVDVIYSSNNIPGQDILSIANLNSIWGQGVEEPFIAIENLKIKKEDIALMKKGTLKITMPNGISLIKFGSSDEEYENLYSELGCVTINVVGTCSRNEWNGNITPQIKIKDYEIVDRMTYYF